MTMSEKNKPEKKESVNKKSTFWHRLRIGHSLGWILGVAGIAFMLIVYLLSTRYDFSKIEQEADSTVRFLQNICQKYDDYQMGDLAQDLQEQINAADMLCTYAGDEALTDTDSLSAFVDNMSLTGVFVLDGQLNTMMHVDRDGNTEGTLLRHVLQDGNVDSILENHDKNFADQAQIGRRSFNYAVSAAEHFQGVIICYTDITKLKNDQNELSLQSLVTGNSFRKSAVVVITDGDHILGTNATQLQGLRVAECPFTNVNESGIKSRGNPLIRLKNDGKIWYGVHALYRDYYLYVFYDAAEIFSDRMLYLGAALSGYMLLALVIIILQQHNDKLLMAGVQKEYHLVRAIGSIYSTNLLLRLDDNTWEPILEADILHGLIDHEIHADAVIRIIGERLVHQGHRQGFLEFADLHTMKERMGNRAFLGFTFENIDNKWYQSLLIPQDADADGQIHSVMVVFRDVSEQKRREMEYQEKLRLTTAEAERANVAKTDFLRRMSHDVRTPINGIRGMTDIAKKNLSDKTKLSDCLDKITQASDFLLDLVNDVLDMSKLESGEVHLAEEPFDLRDLMRDMLNVIETQAIRNGLTLYRHEPEGTHWHLIGSPVHVRQILMNILSNAVKYNQEHGSITVGCTEVSVDDVYVTYEFVCADTGIGMSPEFQKHAYETFTQEHEHARTVYSGTGLGLSIAKKLVDCMGGSIEFVSAVGMGTIFTIRLRFRMDEQYEQGQTLTPEDQNSLKGEHILVVEDNELNMEIAEYMLTEKGATVVKAADGWQAVNLFAASANGTFTCILMDIMMPVMNGLEAARKIRSLTRPDAAVVPIIAMSANAFSDDIANSRAAGMNAHLAKPLDFDKVCEQIHKCSQQTP